MQKVLVSLMIICLILSSHSFGTSVEWTEAELKYIESHQDKELILGLDPYSGMDFFYDFNEVNGYVKDIEAIIENSTGLKIKIEGTKTWSDVYEGLFDHTVDILFGANETPDRLLTMAFTKPVYKYPYIVMVRKDSQIQTIGDLDDKKVGYIEGDVVIDSFPKLYKNIQLKTMVYDQQLAGLQALKKAEIEGFITANGGIVKEFTYKYPEITTIAEVRTVTSDMTFSALKSNQILVDILNKVFENNTGAIQNAILKAEQAYNIKMLDLTVKERLWIESGEPIIVGIADDYLPFDYFENGRALGITGKVVDSLFKSVGIKYSVVHGSFDKLYSLAEQGEIDVLNMAKTDERVKLFNFPRPFSEERDIIYGRSDQEYVQDVYELEGKKVAIIKGFWHKDYLIKNLNKVDLVETNDIQESLELVNSGYADYFIENPTVAEYYIQGLDYNEIIQKGKTSAGSFLYLGVNRNKPELYSILDKCMALLDYDFAKDEGLQTVPALKSRAYGRVVLIATALAVILSGAVVVLMRLMTVVVRQRTETQILKEKEKLIYTDALTKLYNRMYFNHIEKSLESSDLPQVFIMTDLNQLKFVNDTYGHKWGDALILKYAEVLKRVFPEAIIIRMGGDEFLIICHTMNSRDLDHRLVQFEDECKNAKVSIGEIYIHAPEAAFGSYIRTDREQSVNDSVFLADQAMYECKAKMKKHFIG